MRKIFISLGLGFWLAVCSALLPSSNAQVHAREDTTITAAQEMLAWQQQYMTIVTELSSIMSADNISFLYGLDYDDIDSVNLEFSEYDSKREKILSNVAQLKAKLPPPERWDIQKSLFDRTEKALFKAMKEQYKGLNSMIEDFEIASDFSVIMDEAISGNSETALHNVIIRQIDASERMIQAENSQVDAFLLAIPKNNPNHQFQQIVKATNLAGLQEARWSRLILQDGTIEDRQALGLEMKNHLKAVPDLIDTGRKNIKSSKRKFEALINNTRASSQQKQFFRQAIKALDTFEATFETEDRIFQNQRQTSNLMQTAFTDDEQEAEQDKIDLEFYELIDKRAAIMTDRLALMGQ